MLSFLNTPLTTNNIIQFHNPETPNNRWIIKRIQLKNIALINGVADLNFNAESSIIFGKNGVGKSSALDIFKCQLSGKGIRFNLGGSNGKASQRNLEGYLLGKWNDTQSLRNKGDNFSSWIMTTYTNGQEELSHLTIWKLTESGIKDIDVFGDKDVDLSTFKGFSFDMKNRIEFFEKHGFTLLKQSESSRRHIESRLAKVGLTKSKIRAIVNMPSLGSVSSTTSLIETDLPSTLPLLDGPIKDFIDSNEAAKASKESLDKLKDKEEILTAIKTFDKELTKNQQEQTAIQEELSLIIPVGARERIKELSSEQQTEYNNKENSIAKVELLDGQLDEIQTGLEDIAVKLSNALSNTGAETVEKAIKEAKQERDRTKQKQYEINSNLNTLNKYLSTLDFESFDGTQSYLNEISELSAEKEQQEIELIQSESNDKLIVVKTLTNNINSIENQIEALLKQQHSIPQEYVGVQQLLMKEFPALTKENLPFLGELIRVREDLSEHKPIVEAVLRELNLPCALLLPKRFEQEVNAFLSDYAKVNSLPNIRFLIAEENAPLDLQTVNENHIWYSLEFKESAYRNWLSGYLKSLSDLHLQSELQSLTTSTGVTNGVFKQKRMTTILAEMLSKATFNYSLLGWTNKEAIESLRSELKTLNVQKTETNKELKTLNESIALLRKRENTILNLVHFIKTKSLDDFNLSKVEQLIENLDEEIEVLEAQLKEYDQSNYIAFLKDEQVKLNNKKASLDKARSEANKTIGSIENKILQINQNIAKMELVLFEHNVFNNTFEQNILIQKILTKIEKIKGDDTIDIKAKTLALNQEKSLNQLRNKENVLIEQIKNKQGEYIKKHDAIHLGEGVHFIQEFLKELETISNQHFELIKDRLEEKNRQQIKDKLNVILNLLLEKEQEIIDIIALKDGTMKRYPFSPQSYMTLKAVQKDRKITDVYKHINLLSDIERVVKSSDDDILQEEISRIINNIHNYLTNQEWIVNNLDVRKWFRFEIKEKQLVNGEEIEVRDWSSNTTSSGGQGEKALYYLMAIFHFSTEKEDEQDNKPYFATLFIDEAFAKCDVQVMEYTSNLYKELGLQFIPIMPKGGALTSESFRSKYHNFFMFARDEAKPNKGCQVFTLSREKFAETVNND